MFAFARCEQAFSRRTIMYIYIYTNVLTAGLPVYLTFDFMIFFLQNVAQRSKVRARILK